MGGGVRFCLERRAEGRRGKRFSHELTVVAGSANIPNAPAAATAVLKPVLKTFLVGPNSLFTLPNERVGNGPKRLKNSAWKGRRCKGCGVVGLDCFFIALMAKKIKIREGGGSNIHLSGGNRGPAGRRTFWLSI